METIKTKQNLSERDVVKTRYSIYCRVGNTFFGKFKIFRFPYLLIRFYSNKLARITLPLIMAFKGGYFADRYFLLILRINNVGLGGHFLC